MIFVDTSAIYALLDRSDACHPQAAAIWAHLVDKRETLLTTNYVVLECFALTQSRLGMAAARRFNDDLLPVLETVWIDRDEHTAAVETILSADRRGLSLVDATSFRVMRRRDLRRAFAFDDDFARQGFDLLAP
ncbi:MAG: PIN domain-containing protein [Acidobacteriota bacterium]|jgi:predicted nucleic acid-binding protein